LKLDSLKKIKLLNFKTEDKQEGGGDDDDDDNDDNDYSDTEDIEDVKNPEEMDAIVDGAPVIKNPDEADEEGKEENITEEQLDDVVIFISSNCSILLL
jgi:hypothetical protein